MSQTHKLFRVMGQFNKDQVTFLNKEAKRLAEQDGSYPSIARVLRVALEDYRKQQRK